MKEGQERGKKIRDADKTELPDHEGATYVFPAQSLLTSLTVDIGNFVLPRSEMTLLYNPGTDIDTAIHTIWVRRALSPLKCMIGYVHIPEEVCRTTSTMESLMQPEK